MTDNIRRVFRAALLAGGAMFLLLCSARADLLDQYAIPDPLDLDLPPAPGVLAHEHSGYEPIDIRLGNVVIRTALTEGIGYDDNVNATRSARGSPVLETSGNILGLYDTSSVHGNANVTVDDVEYVSQPRQSHTNWTASLGGGYDIGRDVASVSYTHQNLYQTAQNLNTPQLESAVAYRVDQVHVAYRINLARLFVTPSMTVSNYDYDNGIAGSTVLNQTYRNRVVFEPTVTAGYRLGRTTVLGLVRVAEGDYTSRILGQPSRDFIDISALAGLDYEASDLVRVRALGGYQVRSFASAAYKTISAPVGLASTVWNPTRLTTVTAQVVRRIQDSADETTTGVTESGVTLAVDHELYRNVILHGAVGFFNDGYSQIKLTQSLYTASVGATYLLNRHLQVSAGYRFTARRNAGGRASGTQIGESYNDSQVLLQLRIAP